MKPITSYATKRYLGRAGLRGLGKTLSGLSKYTEQFARLQDAGFNGVTQNGGYGGGPELGEVVAFGSNPGALRMFVHTPEKLQAKPALVVVLHGCTQSAAAYDHGSGWSALADRHGFVVLFPEQQGSNNPKTCFTWFQPSDTTRGQGEVHSIRQMIDRAIADHGIDKRRVFVTGLSAGGAMAASMLAAYPEVFAGGAIIAGLPHGAASSVNEAFSAMFQGQRKPAKARGDAVRSASPHKGPWPRVSIWHGDADATVKPVNGDELVKQWTDVHGLSKIRPQQKTIGKTLRRTWSSDAGEALVSEYVIPGMGHGTPVDTAQPGVHGEHAAAYFLDVGISSTAHIAESWGLLTEAKVAKSETSAKYEPNAHSVPKRMPSVPEMTSPSTKGAPTSPSRALTRRAGEAEKPDTPTPHAKAAGKGATSGYEAVESIITKALRSAGLMK